MSNSNKRLYTLDYLRGLSAFGIMIYHCLTWTYGAFPAHSFMGKWGIYGVSIFYILSGLTLFHVYFKRMEPSFNDLKDFFLKRLFRIFPLLWLVIFLTILASGVMPSINALVANLTGLFSIIKWDGYIGTGVWSIGNELVFYLFFPVFIFLTQKSKPLFYTLCAVLFSIFIYFAFFKMDPNLAVVAKGQWSMYVNPLNQVFLFLSGYLLGLYFTNLTLSKLTTTLIFLAALVAFIFYNPVNENLGSGLNRTILSSLSFFICFSFYKNTLRLPSLIDKGLTMLGEVSYSVYLLHPLVWLCLQKITTAFAVQLSPVTRLVCTIVITVIISYLNYKYFETFFINLGKKFSSAVNKQNKVKSEQGIPASV